MKEYEDIAIEVKDYIAKITIQRPPNNFFDSFLIQQIADAYEELDGIDEALAKRAFELGAAKLPISTKFITRGIKI